MANINVNNSNTQNNPNGQQNKNDQIDLNTLFFNLGADGEPNFSQLIPANNVNNQNNNQNNINPSSSFLGSITGQQNQQGQQDPNQQLITNQAQQIQALQNQVNQLLGAYNGVQQTLTSTNLNNQQQQGQRKTLTERFSEPDGEQYLANLLVQAVNMGVESRLQPLQPLFQQQVLNHQVQNSINEAAKQFPDFREVVTPRQAEANQLLSQGFTPREIYLSLKLDALSNGNQNNNNNYNNVVNMNPQRPMSQQEYNSLQQQQKNLYMSSGNFGQITGNQQFSNPVFNNGGRNDLPTLDQSFAMAVNDVLRRK